MGKIVFMFPGQGAQYVGMGKDFYDSFACSKEIFDKANEVLDIDVKKLCFEENEDINIPGIHRQRWELQVLQS